MTATRDGVEVQTGWTDLELVCHGLDLAYHLVVGEHAARFNELRRALRSGALTITRRDTQ